MFPAWPGEDHCFGKVVYVLRHELNDGIAIVRQGIGYRKFYGFVADCTKFYDLPAFDHNTEEAIPVGVGTPSFLYDRNVGIGDRK